MEVEPNLSPNCYHYASLGMEIYNSIFELTIPCEFLEDPLYMSVAAFGDDWSTLMLFPSAIK